MTSRTLATMLVLIVLAASLSGCVEDGEEENEPPSADAGDDVEAEVGEDVVFQGIGLDEDGSIVAFKWDFDGDGEWDYEGDVGARTHMYVAPGHYQAMLEVEDDAGAVSNDTRWVNVTTSVRVLVNWTDQLGFRVRVSERLDPTRLEVDWILESDPSPLTRTFTLDAGLEPVNGSTYDVTVTDASPMVGQHHEVVVRVGDARIGGRSIDVVASPTPESTYSASYYEEAYDYRETGLNWTELYRQGYLLLEGGSGWSSGAFSGVGNYTTWMLDAGVSSLFDVPLDNVTWVTGSGPGWGGDWYLLEGGEGGQSEQWGAGGYYAVAFVHDFERRVENGSLVVDDWRRVGRFSGENETNGTFEWTRTTEGNMVRQNGEGDLYEVLTVVSVKEFEGTNLGREFYLHNRTVDHEASRLIFDNRTIYRGSVQNYSLENATGAMRWTNTTWEGFLDEDGDGTYNPDSLAYDQVLAARFEGPRPRVLQVGDRYSATNFYGVKLDYSATRMDTAPLPTAAGDLNVTGVYTTATHNTSWGRVLHWQWVLGDGPRPGLVFEEQIEVERDVYGAGVYRRYRNIQELL